MRIKDKLVNQQMNKIKTLDKVDKEDENDGGMYYNVSKPILSVMKEYKGDFGVDLFSELLTRQELSHLLLSDIQSMVAKLEKEFPDIIKVKTIGQTW